MKKQILLIVFLFFAPILIYSQDTIVRTNGDLVICKIQKENKSTVSFTITKNGREISTFMNKSDVQSIHYDKPAIVKKHPYNSLSPQHINKIEFSVGSSIATGEFAKDDITNEKSGLAGNGLSVNALFSHSFSPSIGLGVKGYYNRNKFKADKLADAIAAMSNLSFSNNRVNYNSYGFLAGPVFYLPIDRLSINGRLFLGYANLTETETTFSFISNSGSGWIKMSEVSAGAFIYNLGTGLTYTLNDNWDLLANADYLSGHFKFGFYTLSSSIGDREKGERGSQNYGVFNISIGLGLKF